MSNTSKLFVCAALLGLFSRSVFAEPISFYIDSDSDVGIGTNLPTAKLHVTDSNDAKILVENSSTALGTRVLFEISSRGNTKFSVTNTNPALPDAMGGAVEWSFANPGTGLRFSRQGSGVVEFEVKNNGDTYINGDAHVSGTVFSSSDVNAKQDIEAIDQHKLLARVMALPITEWSYKKTPQSRHIGPTAQDFYKSFGLGATEKAIASIDTGGVALAAIQGLKHEKDKQLSEKDAEIAALRNELEVQDERLLQLEIALAELLHKQPSEVHVSSTN